MELTDLLVTSLILLTAAAVYFHLKKFSYWSSRNVRGPTPWPIWGTNIYYLFENKLVVDARWQEEYGKVYGLYEGYSPLLRVNDRELLNFIYVKQFGSFTDRHNEFIYSKVMRKWMLWLPGKEWSAQRPLVAGQFTSSKMKLMAQNMSDCINRFFEEIERRSLEAKSNPSEGARDGVEVKKNDIADMTLDVIGTNFFSLKLDTYRDKSNEFLKQAYSLSLFSLGRFLLWSFTPRQIAKMLKFELFPAYRFEYFDLLTKKILKERKDKNVKKQDLVQALIDAKLKDTLSDSDKSGENELRLYSGQRGEEQLATIQKINTKPLVSLSELDIRGQMSFLLIAGFEATSTALNFCFLELAQQPKMQELIHDELKTVFGAKAERLAAKNEPFPSEIYPELMDTAYLNAFISETLRLYPPIIDNNRKAVEQVALPTEPELVLPAGMPISTGTFVLHRDPDYWRDPEKFDLTRFLPENKDQIKQGAYQPFGMGSRHCLGMRFVLLEMRLALAKTILNYHIMPAADHPPKFQRNVVFLLVENDQKFKLVPREN